MRRAWTTRRTTRLRKWKRRKPRCSPTWASPIRTADGRRSVPRGEVALAPEEDAQREADQQQQAEDDPEAARAVDQRQAFEVHPEEAGHEIERQEDRGQHGQRAHD